MADEHERTPEHRKAHDLADKAVDAAIDGKTEAARRLAEEAKRIDPKIEGEMAEEIEAERRQAEAFVKREG